MGINLDFNHEVLQNKFLYYPCAGNDFEEPIKTFRGFISNFWFVDTIYFLNGHPASTEVSPLDIPGFNHIRSEVIGPVTTKIERRVTSSGNSYQYIEPGIRKDYYEYQNRNICVNRRRGFGYNSFFGPTSLPIDIENLGVFFYRGDSSERGICGGSSHLWMSTQPVRMLRDHKRVSLLSLVINAIPNKAFLATDGSNHLYSNKQYQELFKFHNDKEISCDKAVELSRNFSDSSGKFFTCVGHAGMKCGPTLIWQITKETN